MIRVITPEHRAKMVAALRAKGPWNKGKKMSIEQRKKLSDIHKKNPNRYWLGKKRSFLNRKKPKPFSEEHRQHISKALKGVIPWNKGISVSYAGEKHHSWIDGRSRERDQARSTDMKHAPYREWRRQIFKRDGYKCKWCGIGGYVTAHHIKTYRKYPELRYEINNGITLCKPCHLKTNGKESLFEQQFFVLLTK